MFSIIFLSLLILISKVNASDLQIYFDLIDSNFDGRISNDEIIGYFSKFYEGQLTTAQANQIIDKYRGNSTNDFLTISNFCGFDKLLFSIYQPEQVHLSFTHNIQTEMFISFVTRHRPSADHRPVIKYGQQELIAIGNTTTYDIDNWKSWVHFIYIKNLDENTKYNYQLGFIDPDNKTISHLFSDPSWAFQTMPSNDQEEIVYIYGDMGTMMPYGFEVMKAMIDDMKSSENQRANYVVHVGDLAYAGTGDHLESQTIWDLFVNQIEPIASQIPYMTAVGNHEKYYNYTSYRTRFFMPSKTNPTEFERDENFYFSLETNLIQWIFMSTEHNYTAGSRQRIFLENLLEQYKQKWQGKERPWLILVGHRPMYSSDKATDSGRLQQEIEPLVINYGVDLAVWGHMHCYERTTPVQYNNFTDREHFSADGKIYEHDAKEFNQTSPIHLVVGFGGAWIDETWSDKPQWSQVRNQRYGFGKLFVHNKTHLEFRSTVLNKEHDDDEDQFTIIRHF